MSFPITVAHTGPIASKADNPDLPTQPMEIAGAVEHAYRAGLRPRMATLNTCSMSFGASKFRNPPADMRRLTARMFDLGVKPELYDTGHLEACLRLRDEGLLGEGRPQLSIVLGVAGSMS